MKKIIFVVLTIIASTGHTATLNQVIKNSEGSYAAMCSDGSYGAISVNGDGQICATGNGKTAKCTNSWSVDAAGIYLCKKASMGKTITIQKGALVYTERYGKDGVVAGLSDSFMYKMDSMAKPKLTSSQTFKIVKHYVNPTVFQRKDGHLAFEKTPEVKKGLNSGSYNEISLIDNYFQVSDKADKMYFFRESSTK